MLIKDLLDDYELDTDVSRAIHIYSCDSNAQQEIDLVHRGISSIPALNLGRFQGVEVGSRLSQSDHCAKLSFLNSRNYACAKIRFRGLTFQIP